MPTAVQFRRGTTAQHSTFTGSNGELTVDTDKKTVVVHDGTTAGGVPVLRQDLANMPTSSNGYGTRTVSTSDPSGGANGDIWLKV